MNHTVPNHCTVIQIASYCNKDTEKNNLLEHYNFRKTLYCFMGEIKAVGKQADMVLQQ